MKQQAVGLGSSGLLDASTKIKALAQDTSVRRVHKARLAKEPTNPIYLLAAITLGIPLLSMIPLVGLNPGIQDGTFTTFMTFLVASAFITAVVFEIKRLADQSSDEEHR
jgi:hypothetical protein